MCIEYMKMYTIILKRYATWLRYAYRFGLWTYVHNFEKMLTFV